MFDATTGRITGNSRNIKLALKKSSALDTLHRSRRRYRSVTKLQGVKDIKKSIFGFSLSSHLMLTE